MRSTKILSVSLDDGAKSVTVPYKCLEGIWHKATQLINTEEAITLAPEHAPEARMVLSYTGKVPHLVTRKKRNDFSCDVNCCNWKLKHKRIFSQ